jgi:hypothetical protein
VTAPLSWRRFPFLGEEMGKRDYYFSTRDLLMMAALAALGGVASIYINAVGDFFQSLLGFAGTTQWAAGLGRKEGLLRISFKM